MASVLPSEDAEGTVDPTVAASDEVARHGPVVRWHFWVIDPPQATGRWPGLLVEWR